MKVAVCYSGNFRTFRQLIENHKQNFLSLYDCDVYCSFWNHYGVSLRHYYWADNEFNNKLIATGAVETDLITEEDKDFILKELNPVSVEYEDFNSKKDLFTEMSRDIQNRHTRPYYRNIVSMFYKIWKCNNLVKKDYDVVVRMRPDMYFFNPFDKLLTPQPNCIYTDHNEARSMPELGGCNDIFAYGDKASMQKYSKSFSNWFELMHWYFNYVDKGIHPVDKNGDTIWLYKQGAYWSGEIVLKANLLYEDVNIVNDSNLFLQYKLFSEVFYDTHVESVQQLTDKILT